jgi:hypothetical protein
LERGRKSEEQVIVDGLPADKAGVRLADRLIVNPLLMMVLLSGLLYQKYRIEK